jgi:DNA polymerase-3 subunit epsilon
MVVVFDTETSGLSPQRHDRIIEIGAVKLNENGIVEEFSSLIDADVIISPYAQAVHGISAQMLYGQPQPAQVFRAFQQFVGRLPLVAHNAGFDRNFLRAEYERLGYRLTNKVECTLQLSRKQLRNLPNHKLETVYLALGGVIDKTIQRHRALDDARMAAFVWRELQGVGA